MPLRQENLSKLKQTFPEKNGGYKSSGLGGGSIVLVKQAGRHSLYKTFKIQHLMFGKP